MKCPASAWLCDVNSLLDAWLADRRAELGQHPLRRRGGTTRSHRARSAAPHCR